MSSRSDRTSSLKDAHMHSVISTYSNQSLRSFWITETSLTHANGTVAYESLPLLLRMEE